MPGAFHLFRLFGIDVYLHWLWLVVAVWVITDHDVYDHRLWNVLEYVSLFAIVLMHEFGHSLACRSVGGKANRIMLWPLGGIAFVQPPARPGAVLWSIAAGPLVNVVLAAPLIVAAMLVEAVPGASKDLVHFVEMLAVINIVLLVFNMMPVYPLDGGQILQSLLWFVVGRTRSLRIAASIGLVAALLLGLATLASGKWLLFAIALFIGLQAWQGFRMAKVIADVEAHGDGPQETPTTYPPEQ